jgi:hypothetical protein
MAMANLLSVTVSIAALTKGMLILIFLVSWVLVLVLRGNT